ncbi:MAG: glycosyltransferase family 4 protein [Patescibacteria group bacterium]
MRIAIDVSQVIYKTGVSVYTKNLVQNLLKIDKENEYVLFGGYGRGKRLLGEFINGLSGNFTTKLFPIPPTLADLVWNRLHLLPIEKLIGAVDVFHSSDWSEPPSQAFKVTTVHDLAPIRFPKLTHPKIYRAHKKRLEWVKKEADRIIVPSEATKKEMESYGFDTGNVRVIPEASDIKPASPTEVARIKQKYNITGKYLLAIGTNPRKNISRIIKAFDLVRAGEDLKLVVIVTPRFEVGERRGLRLVEDKLSQEELAAFYTGAEVLVYPSLYEGFGLPILDSFACGVPVVTSNLSSMAEVAGNAAVLVDPYEVESIVEGIRTALRGKLGLYKKGMARVSRFSWEKTAKMTLDVYSEAKK